MTGANDKWGGAMLLSESMLDAAIPVPTDAEKDHARHVIAERARDADDARVLMQALGLIP